ncbi:MAG: hypothetical protein Q8M99_10095 [Methylotenera sp.]|nr:hypothetical protein [Methylotenera sp.]
MNGKYSYDRYVFLKKRLNKFDRNSFCLALATIKLNGIPDWTGKHDDIEWITLVLGALEICQVSRINKVAVMLAELSLAGAEPGGHYLWPSALTATMYRYEAYYLATITTPKPEVSRRLNAVWSEKYSVEQIANKYHISTQMLYRQIKKWGGRIMDLKEKGVDESIISLVFQIKHLLKV